MRTSRGGSRRRWRSTSTGRGPRSSALARWREIEPARAPELARLQTLCDSGGGSAEETRTLLATGGVIEFIAARFAAEIGLWQPWTPPRDEFAPIGEAAQVAAERWRPAYAPEA